MGKINCWEFNKCIRGNQGKNTFAECKTLRTSCLNEINGGINGGRSCWCVAGTIGAGDRSCALIQDAKIKDCVFCEFYDLVLNEEGNKFSSTIQIMNLLSEEKNMD